MVLQRSKYVCYLLLLMLFLLTTFRYFAEYRIIDKSATLNRRDFQDDVKLADFYRTWCEIRKYRKDWERIRQPCQGLIPWGSTQEGWDEPTDSSRSVIISRSIRPTYEFSRIFIESRTAKGERKRIGGDSWRVHLRGPSSPVITVYDHQNGIYEAVFLLLEPGLYSVHAYLEHSLCDGIKDPPDDWFMIGNAQGKYQPEGTLGNDHAYISTKLNISTKDSKMHVKSQHSMEYLEAVDVLMKTKVSICDDSCNLIWDGYGRWVNGLWRPYKTTRAYLYDEQTNLSNKTDHNVQATYNGKLWFYGDSVMEQFYNHVKLFGNLCQAFTNGCSHTYNWIYSIRGFNTTIAKTENDDKDFNITRILEEISRVAYHPLFNKPDSVLFMNFGLHFVSGTKLADYKILISGIIDLLKYKYVGKVVWRTTTSLFKHKLGGKHEQARRFLNHQRVLLFNALATNQMCAAGFPVLDLFPLTDSYPNGTGLAGFKYDAVHYEHIAFSTAERRLEEMFRHREI